MPMKEKFLVILNKLSLLENASSTKNITKQIPIKASNVQLHLGNYRKAAHQPGRPVHWR